LLTSKKRGGLPKGPACQFEFPKFRDSGWQLNPVKQLRDTMPVRAARIAEGILALRLTLGLQDIERVFSAAFECRARHCKGKRRFFFFLQAGPLIIDQPHQRLLQIVDQDIALMAACLHADGLLAVNRNERFSAGDRMAQKRAALPEQPLSLDVLSGCER
jgi:hypothetical protein